MSRRAFITLLGAAAAWPLMGKPKGENMRVLLAAAAIAAVFATSAQAEIMCTETVAVGRRASASVS
jgi:hypothetical protein